MWKMFNVSQNVWNKMQSYHVQIYTVQNIGTEALRMTMLEKPKRWTAEEIGLYMVVEAQRELKPAGRKKKNKIICTKWHKQRGTISFTHLQLVRLSAYRFNWTCELSVTSWMALSGCSPIGLCWFVSAFKQLQRSQVLQQQLSGQKLVQCGRSSWWQHNSLPGKCLWYL